MPSTRYSLGMPTRRPFTDLPQKLGKSGTSASMLVESFGSWPDMDFSRMAVSSTVRAMGPAWSGAEPPDEPPGVGSALPPWARQGFTTGPQAEVSLDEPMANSSMLSLPSMTAPSRHRLEV